MKPNHHANPIRQCIKSPHPLRRGNHSDNPRGFQRRHQQKPSIQRTPRERILFLLRSSLHRAVHAADHQHACDDHARQHPGSRHRVRHIQSPCHPHPACHGARQRTSSRAYHFLRLVGRIHFLATLRPCEQPVVSRTRQPVMTPPAHQVPAAHSPDSLQRLVALPRTEFYLGSLRLG